MHGCPTSIKHLPEWDQQLIDIDERHYVVVIESSGRWPTVIRDSMICIRKACWGIDWIGWHAEKSFFSLLLHLLFFFHIFSMAIFLLFGVKMSTWICLDYYCIYDVEKNKGSRRILHILVDIGRWYTLHILVHIGRWHAQRWKYALDCMWISAPLLATKNNLLGRWKFFSSHLHLRILTF